MQTHSDVLYQQDFYAWIYHNIDLLRQRKFSKINVETLIEELESIARQERYQLESSLAVLMAHLLIWQYQSEHRSGDGRGAMMLQRILITRQLQMSPNLKSYWSEAIQEAYPDAVEIAVARTEVPRNTFPPSCPYSIEQLLDEDFYPDTH